MSNPQLFLFRLTVTTDKRGKKNVPILVLMMNAKLKAHENSEEAGNQPQYKD